MALDLNTASDSFVDPALLDPDSAEMASLLAELDGAADGEVTAGGESPPSAGGVADPGAGAAGGNPPAVAAADGEHQIPMAELQRARQEAAQNRDALAAAQRELEEMRRQLAGKPAAGDTVDAEIEPGQTGAGRSTALIEKMEALAKDFPEFGEVAGGIVAELKQVQEAVAVMAADYRQRAEARLAEVKKETEQVVANNAHVSLWIEQDPEAHRRAFFHDQRLQKDPLWANRPIAERVQAAVDLTLAEYPAAKRPTGSPAAPRSAASGPDLAQRLAALQEQPPESLTHVPGGAPPGADPLATTDPVQLEAMLEGMSPQQIDAFLARYG